MNLRVDRDTDAGPWDRFVSSQPTGHFMQSYAWGAFQRELGWEPRYCKLEDESGIRAAALLLMRSVPGAGWRVFYAPRGPAVDFSDAALTAEFFGELRAFVKSEKGVFLRCDPYAPESSGSEGLATVTRVPRDWSYWNAPRFVFWLDLGGDEDAVMKRMNSSCRNEVRRAYKNGVQFSTGGEGDIADFHRLMGLMGNQKGIAFHGVEFYRRLFAVVRDSADVGLFLGRFDDRAITAGMSVAYGRKAWLLYAASDPAHYKLRGNRAQQWEMIKWAHAKGCERYDFRGTATDDPPNPKDPGYGVYEFKKSFGPEFTRLLGYYDVIGRPLVYSALRAAEERVLPAAYRVRTWLQRS
ncbi:MAG: lipid II:glycine glycyltransferase FemX [Dehalococcoidia bacterium]